MKNLDLRYGEIPTAEQFITRQRVLQSETAIYVRESLSPCLQGRSSSARWVHLLLSEAGFRLRRCQRNQSFKDPARINASESSPLLLLLPLLAAPLSPRIIRRVFESCRVRNTLSTPFFSLFFCSFASSSLREKSERRGPQDFTAF